MLLTIMSQERRIRDSEPKVTTLALTLIKLCETEEQMALLISANQPLTWGWIAMCEMQVVIQHPEILELSKAPCPIQSSILMTFRPKNKQTKPNDRSPNS